MRTVRDIMEREVLSLSTRTPVADAAALLSARQISGAPVCAPDGRAVGMLTKSDLADGYGSSKAGTCVGELMTPEVLSVRPEDPIERAIQLMAFEGVHRLVVMDEEGHVVGIISSMDVLRELAGYPRHDTRVIAVAPPDDPPAQPPP